MKILWTLSGNGVCEGHDGDELCPKCGHHTLTQVWYDNNQWNGYSYDGDFVWECRYCQLLKKEGTSSTEPNTENQKILCKALMIKHKNKQTELMQKKERQRNELNNTNKQLNQFK
jgi:hypothetical protein